MQSTIQARLNLSSQDAQTLDQMAALHGSMKRKLYAQITGQGGKPHRCATGITGDGGNAVPLSTDYRSPAITICMRRFVHHYVSGI
ncbi:hypothetical protein [Paraburkholderia aspalathi]|uniref:Uncharacterized protein n=1 Tax=Paraburkholderia aspalathi TaxID=1324617 RepID=A0A1I7EQX5_9BURK|nr:hypothetical protein [Paraburkholderia aspalathi]SFU26338.1 hypothetical protein SAMN05192563_105228 [Paraburkholderia aspalathi]